MNLSEIRAEFVKQTGRYDLMDATDGSDLGADYYIKAGSKFLDRKLTELNPSNAYSIQPLATGQYFLKFENYRAIKHVFVVDAAGNSYELTKQSLVYVKSIHGQLFSKVDVGTPVDYCPALLRLQPEYEDQTAAEVAVTDANADVVIADHVTYRGIVIMPPPSEDVTIQAEGLFLSAPLVSNSSSNFWTVNEPELLLKAAMRELEVMMRNSQGVKDWEAAIATELYALECDLVEDQLDDDNVLGG